MNIYTHAVPAALREANSKVVRLVLSAQVLGLNAPLSSLANLQLIVRKGNVGRGGGDRTWKTFKFPMICSMQAAIGMLPPCCQQATWSLSRPSCRLLPPQQFSKYIPNNKMRSQGCGVETHNLHSSCAFFRQVDYFRLPANCQRPARARESKQRRVTA